MISTVIGDMAAQTPLRLETDLPVEWLQLKRLLPPLVLHRFDPPLPFRARLTSTRGGSAERWDCSSREPHHGLRVFNDAPYEPMVRGDLVFFWWGPPENRPCRRWLRDCNPPSPVGCWRWTVTLDWINDRCTLDVAETPEHTIGGWIPDAGTLLEIVDPDGEHAHTDGWRAVRQGGTAVWNWAAVIRPVRDAVRDGLTAMLAAIGRATAVRSEHYQQHFRQGHLSVTIAVPITAVEAHPVAHRSWPTTVVDHIVVPDGLGWIMGPRVMDGEWVAVVCGPARIYGMHHTDAIFVPGDWLAVLRHPLHMRRDRYD